MPTYELTFVIDPIDDDEIGRLAENGIDWSQMGRLQFAHIDQVADTPSSAVRAGHCVLEAVGVRSRRLRLDLVSASEIAARTGVSRPAVTKWTRQTTGDTAFPLESTGPPLGRSGSGTTSTNGCNAPGRQATTSAARSPSSRSRRGTD